MRCARPGLILALVFSWACGGPNESVGPDPVPPTESTPCELALGAGAVILPDGEVVDDLRTALMAARPDDELKLCPGRYHGNFVAEVPLRLTAVEDAAVTVLDGISDLPTLEIPGGSEVVGLTIRGGGGVRMSSQGPLGIVDAVITGNQADYGAGVVVAENSVATLSGTVITGNMARKGGGGVWVQPGGRLELLDGSRVSLNWAGLFGAGIWLEDAHITGGLVSDNVLVAGAETLPLRDEHGVLFFPAEAFGGSGVALSGTGSLTGVEVTGNLGLGGAFSVIRGTASLTDVWIHANHSDSIHAGGGLAVIEAHVSGEGNTRVERNTAYSAAGAWVHDGSVTGVDFSENVARLCGGLLVESGALRNAVISENQASSGGGGGLCVSGAVRVESVTLTNNQSTSNGGALHIQAPFGISTDVEIVGCTLSGNHAASRGGGIHVEWSPIGMTVLLADSELSGNSASSDGGGVYTDALLDITNSRITGNAADHGGGAYVAQRGALSVTDCDFGEGEHENTPDDVATPSASYEGYASGTEFSCDTDGCTPEP